MIKDIIELLIPTLEALNYTEKVGGIATPLQIKKVTQEGTTIKIIPVYYNDNQTTCNEDDYIDLTPNSSLRSIIYFEDEGTSVIDCDGHRYFLESSVKLVFWCNLKRINQSFVDASPIALNLIDNIPLKLSNSNPYSMIQLNFAGYEKDPDIFNQWTYDEAEKQFLIYPYDYFALNYTVRFSVGKGCASDITLNPATCF